MIKHKKDILTRFYIVAAILSFFLVAIIFRVVNLQYTQGEKYRGLATDLTIKQDTIYANKGNVYASDGNLLATSMSKYTIRMDVVAIDDSVLEEKLIPLSKELSKRTHLVKLFVIY